MLRQSSTQWSDTRAGPGSCCSCNTSIGSAREGAVAAARVTSMADGASRRVLALGAPPSTMQSASAARLAARHLPAPVALLFFACALHLHFPPNDGSSFLTSSLTHLFPFPFPLPTPVPLPLTTHDARRSNRQTCSQASLSTLLLLPRSLFSKLSSLVPPFCFVLCLRPPRPPSPLCFCPVLRASPLSSRFVCVCVCFRTAARHSTRPSLSQCEPVGARGSCFRFLPSPRFVTVVGARALAPPPTAFPFPKYPSLPIT